MDLRLRSSWGGRSFCVVTGGSRGLGREIALQFSRKLSDDSLILLVARNFDGLEQTKTAIAAIKPNVRVETVARDLTSLTDEDAGVMLRTALDKHSHGRDFDRVFLIHNAGTLGDVSKLSRDLKLKESQEYFALNVHSLIAMTTAFLHTFPEYMDKDGVSCSVVNITSLAALQPFKGWALYCSGKSAREMYMKVLAAEHPKIQVLNYSPGPLDTDMATQIIQSAIPDVAEWFIKAKAKGELIKCEDTVNKLLQLLEENRFKSGEHIDFYDEI